MEDDDYFSRRLDRDEDKLREARVEERLRRYGTEYMSEESRRLVDTVRLSEEQGWGAALLCGRPPTPEQLADLRRDAAFTAARVGAPGSLVRLRAQLTLWLLDQYERGAR